MGFFKKMSEYLKRSKNSDLKRVRVTSSGAFYMKSEDLFNDNKETLELLDKLNESVSKYKKVNGKHFAHAE